MKTKMILIVLSFILSVANAIDDKYTETMTKTIELVYAARTNEETQLAINTFDRIGQAEKNKWEPFYYAAFGYVMMVDREKDLARKDALLDLAKSEIEKASALKTDDSEIVAMEGFISMLRITVDPATRGPQYSMLATKSFGRAIELNPENPRALALMAQMQFGMAQFFKSSTDEACGTARKAMEKFDTYKPASPIAPMWGKGMNSGLLGACK